jgi:hypothetical protein
VNWNISFDYGNWSNSFKEREYNKEDVTIDGRKGYFATKNGFIGLYLPDVHPPQRGGKNHLSMLIRFKKDAELNASAETLLRSLNFVKQKTP